MTSAFTSSLRLWLAFFAVIACFAVVLGRLFYLQVSEKEALRAIVEQNRNRLEAKQARRGSILDSRNAILAISHPVLEVGVDPEVASKEDASKLPILAELLKVDLDWLKAQFIPKIRQQRTPHGLVIKKVRWQPLGKAVPEETYAAIRKLGVRGVYGNRYYQRDYPNESLAAHIIGFINKEDRPVQGIELAMDEYLKGLKGWHEIERDGSQSRREIVHGRSRSVGPISGLNVQLTIDTVIQDYAEQEIARLVELYQPKAVSIIISAPETGYLLGLANYPTFNPNAFWEYPIAHLRNRALTDQYEPGSIFKMVTFAGVLNEDTMPLDAIIDCNQPWINDRGKRRNLPKDHRPLGSLTLDQVLIRSSNRGTAQLGLALGEDKLYRYARLFGFGERPRLGLDAEASGFLAKVEDWDGLTITRLPIGHAISATPLQVHNAMAAIAAKGVLMQPQAVHRILNENKEPVIEFAPKVKRVVMESRSAEQLTAILAQVTQPGGTATRAGMSSFEVAGKTGTTQKIIDGKYSSKHHIASFSGFFPAYNPEVVITIVVDEPQLKGIGYGGLVAAPAFKNIAERLTTYLTLSREQ